MDVIVEQLRFERSRRLVLDIPGLAFLAGTTTAVLGPNGSGKTTLLRLIGGLERPTVGAVRVGSRLVDGDPASRLAIAFAFQEAVFVRGSVRRNLDLALRLRQLPQPERDARIAEVARECGIESVLDRSARQLSGGEAQRANLARALALRAPVTLLDEPLAGIDRAARAQLLDDLPRLLATFASTTVLVTHDREEAFRLADHLALLVNGRVRAAGPKSQVYSRPADGETAALLGYTVLPFGAGAIGVPPGGWRLGEGDPAFWLSVDQVVDMGDHRHAVGSVEGVRVDLRLPVDQRAPSSGERIRITPRSHVTLDRTPFGHGSG
jgi:thiamine transport system ATP-binding protein